MYWTKVQYRSQSECFNICFCRAVFVGWRYACLRHLPLAGQDGLTRLGVSGHRQLLQSKVRYRSGGKYSKMVWERIMEYEIAIKKWRWMRPDALPR